MPEITVKCAAKINLALDVTGKLPNGYHTIESIFQTVEIFDEIHVKLTESGISVNCSVPEKFSVSDEIPCDERNIAFKAARLFFNEYNLNCGCIINIKKGIPSQAGMGGGSSDAAAVLYALNKLTNYNADSEQLARLGSKLGADVPFFLTGGTAYVSGIGEKIEPIGDFSGKILVIAKGLDGVSTAEAYRSIDELVSPKHPKIKELADAINSQDENSYRYFGNLFEYAVKLESVDNIKKIMTESGALSSVMTGSGSAVFGLFPDLDTAEKCAAKLSDVGYFAKVCSTVGYAFKEV